MIKHVNEIYFEGEDRWIKNFNQCSDLYQKANDLLLSEEERNEYWQLWICERQKLELGIY